MGKKKRKKSQKRQYGQSKVSAVKPAVPESSSHKTAEPTSGNRNWKLWLLVLLLVGSAGGIGTLIFLYEPSDVIELPEPREIRTTFAGPNFEDFAGSESCEECHEEQYSVWLTSTHGRAGGPPSPDNVIAPFDGQPMYFQDAVVTPSITDSGEYIFTVEQEETPTIVLEVSGVVGGGHMVGGGTQGYVGEFPDGTVRFLPFDFIREEALWFCNTAISDAWVPITPSMSISECMDWPPFRIMGSEGWSPSCQECHGSQIQLTYDPETGRYDTKILSLSINCESCHGPGKRHVELSDAGFTNDDDDIAIEVLTTRDKDGSLDVCFQCHALKSVLASGYLPGKVLDDHFSLASWVIGASTYYPDGRIRRFAYQQNHVYSDCYLNGSMTCVDCHDPHSQEYRDIWGTPLSDRFADEQCTDCHPSKAERPEEHTFHEPGTPGSKCVDCHMPYIQHPAVGPDLRFARSDHTIPIPRPGSDDRMGVVNACAMAGCHADSTLQSLEEITNEWYGELKPRKPIIEAQTRSVLPDDRVAAAGALLLPDANHPIAQVAAMGQFVKEYLWPNMSHLEPAIVQPLRQLAKDENLDVRSVALATLHYALGEDTETRRFLADQLEPLEELDHPVRARWVIALRLFGDWLGEQRDYSAAITVYKKALEVIPDHATVLYGLGWTYDSMRDYAKAVEYYERSLAAASNQNPSDIRNDLARARQNLARARGW